MIGGQYNLPSWRRCNERLVGSCKDTASGCCGAVVCTLCLIKNEDTYDEEIGSAVESNGEYTGDFGFFGYWRRGYDDSCEFVVEIDGEEVGSFPKCGDYSEEMDCRKLEGVVEYGYDTLRFKYSRPLQLKHHREGKCKSNFCGSCSCTNRFICFTMTGPEGCNFSAVIEYDEAYDLCEDETELPRWYVEADCGYFLYEGWISLERDQYTGDCLLRVPGLDEPIEISDCKPLSAQWEIDNEDDPYTPYQMSIVGTDCGDCEPPEPPLTPGVCGEPGSLYVTFESECQDIVDLGTVELVWNADNRRWNVPVTGGINVPCCPDFFGAIRSWAIRIDCNDPAPLTFPFVSVGFSLGNSADNIPPAKVIVQQTPVVYENPFFYQISGHVQICCGTDPLEPTTICAVTITVTE